QRHGERDHSRQGHPGDRRRDPLLQRTPLGPGADLVSWGPVPTGHEGDDIPRYGPYATVDNNYGAVPDGTCRVSVFNAMTTNGWGYQMGGHVGGPVGISTQPSIRFVAYRVVNLQPEDRLGYTEPVTVNVDMSYGGDGSTFTSPYE